MRIARGWKPFAVLVAALAGGCGGGTNGDAPTQTKPEISAVSGHFVAADENLAVDALTLKGAAGLARPGAVTGPFAYSAKLDELTGPYALGLRVVDNTTGNASYLVSLATQAGTANVTPLTLLVAAEAIGQDPNSYFAGLSIAGDSALADITAARVATVQQRLVRHLRQRLAFTLPGTLGDLITTPFSPVAGDPMFDTISALQAQLVGRGENLFDFAAALAKEAALCNAEDLGVTVGAVLTDFCPKSKTALPDVTDGSIAHYQFTTDAGDVLIADGRDTDVLGATLTQVTGEVFTCSGAGCAGLVIGAPAADLSRALTFTAVSLTGAGGNATLNGTLTSALPGVNLPTLPCSSNRYYVIYPDDSVAATCAAPDSTGLGAGGQLSSGPIRRGYSFETDGSVDPAPPSIEVRADGEQVASVLVYDHDPDTGLPRALFKCVGTACNGVTIAPPDDDAADFPPIVVRLRQITLNDTVLAAVNPDGTFSTTSFVKLRADLTSIEYIFPPPALAPLPCLAATPPLTATLNDDPTQPINVCPPAGDLSGTGLTLQAFLNTSINSYGGLSFFIGSLYGDGQGNTSTAGDAGGVRINLNAAGDAVTDVTFSLLDGSVYRCSGAECTGITIAAPDADGTRAIDITGLVLPEIETGGLKGDRSATIAGSFVAPALPVTPAAARTGRR